MSPSSRGWYWNLGLASLATRSALVRVVVLFPIAFLGECALAQITPDATLGAESSVVTPTRINGVPGDRIDGGAIRGANLFHSFREFNIGEGLGAYFTNPAGIANILSRVTGNDPSDILGRLGVLGGNANLFLINPNGIIFGPNASLDIGGSFVGSTASSLNFADGNSFSATAHSTTPLLTVSVPIGLQYGGIPRSISNQATTNISGLPVGLRVDPSKTLALVGGDVSLDGGILQAPGGRVELGGISAEGTVGLNVDGNNLNLSFPNGVAKADVSLTNGAKVDVTAEGGGSIAVNAENINALGGSSFRAGISLTSKADGAQAGDITFNASEVVIENSSIYNIVLGSGNGGKLLIDTSQLIVRDGIVATATASQGRAGDLIVKAKSVELSSSDTSNGTVFATIPVNIFNFSEVPVRLPIGFFSASIDAQSIFSVQNISNLPPGLDDLLRGILPTAGGNAGNLTIETGRLIVRDGAVVSPGTATAGNAGDLTVEADSIELSGTSANNAPSGFGFLAVADRVPSGLRNGTVGPGSGGNLVIKTGQLIVRNGAVVATNTSSSLSAGKLTVNAKESVELIGTAANGFPSLLATATIASGDANSLTVNTKRLIVRDGGIISAATTGSGQGGELTINATEFVELIGTSTKRFSDSVNQGVFDELPTLALFRQGLLPSGVITGAFREGNANSLTINTRRLSIQDGAQASVYTLGAGNAGSLTVNASSIELAGTSAESPVTNDIVGRSLLTTAVGSNSTGKGGNITVQANSLTITDGAALTASTSGQGDAGNLEVTARSIRLDNQANISANTTAGQGNINLHSQDLVLRRGSNITTNATGTATGGNITIDTDVLAALENSDIGADAQEARGGRVRIDAQGIFGTKFRNQPTPLSDITATSDLGFEFSGTVEINTLDVDPSQGLVELPAVPIDTEVVQACNPGGGQQQSEFVITGRGGLPPNPGDALSTDAVMVDLVTLNPEGENRSSAEEGATNYTRESASTTIVEANGWMTNNKGEVVLTATAPTATLNIPWVPKSDCNAPKQNS